MVNIPVDFGNRGILYNLILVMLSKNLVLVSLSVDVYLTQKKIQKLI